MNRKTTVFFLFACLFVMLPCLRAERLFLENAYFEMYADRDADADLAGQLSNTVVTVVNESLTLPPVFKNKILIELANDDSREPDIHTETDDTARMVVKINNILDIDFSELCTAYAKSFLTNIEIISGLSPEQAEEMVSFNDVSRLAKKIEKLVFPFVSEKSYFYIRAENMEDGSYADDVSQAAAHVGNRMLPLPSYFGESIVIQVVNNPANPPSAHIICDKFVTVKINRIQELRIYHLCEVISDAFLTRIAIYNGMAPESARDKAPFWIKAVIAKEIDVTLSPFIFDQIIVDAVSVTALSVEELENWNEPDPAFINYAFWFFRTLQSEIPSQTFKFLVRDLLSGQKLIDLLPKYSGKSFSTPRDLEIYKATAMRETINRARTSMPVFDIVDSVQRVNDLSKFILSIDGTDKQLTLAELEQYADYPAVQAIAEQRINEAMFIRPRLNPVCANPIQSLCLALECIARKKMKYFGNSSHLFYADVDYATQVIARIYKVAEENNYYEY